MNQNKAVCLFVVLFFATACATLGLHPLYPVVTTAQMRAEFQKAEELYLSKKYYNADRAYEKYITSFGYNEFTDEARFKRGEIAFASGRYENALSFYREAYANLYSPKISPKARFKAAYSLYRLQKFDAALQELSKIKRNDASYVLKTRVDSLGVILSRETKDKNYLVRSYLYLLDDYDGLSKKQESIENLPDIIAEKDALAGVKGWVERSDMSSEEIENLPLKDYKGKRSGGYAFFKYAQVLGREGDSASAKKELKSYVSSYSKHEYYAKALSLLQESSHRLEEAGIKIGLILPLSGKYAVYGESVLHGVECAAGVYEPCEKDSDVQLVIRDSDGQPEKINEAVDELVKEGVIALVGPILSSTVELAARRAQEAGVPMIELSQREGITDIGNFIFRNTVSAKSQVESVVDYSFGVKRMKRFVVLYPKNAQGEEYKKLFEEAVKSKGGRVSSYGYSESRTEFATELRNMPFVSEENKSFDAIFIPDSFGPVGYIATTLGMMGIENVGYFGISRWNDARLVDLGGEYVEGAVFPDAFYKDSPDSKDFYFRFNEAYGATPTLLEGLGYDSLKMILTAVKNGAASRTILRDNLARLSDFSGVTGRISFLETRDTKRTLSLFSVSNGSIKPLSR